MSTVFYRWGAGRDESRVSFDGTHISVFDLKREIILANKMGNGKDFDIGIYDNVTGEEFKDDNHQIPRSSSLIARRLPSSIKGRGNAQNYIVGTTLGESLTGDHRIEAHAKEALLAKQNKGTRFAGGSYGAMSRRFDGKEEKTPTPAVTISTGNAEEDARIKAMFQQQEDQFEQDFEDMSQNPRAAAQYRQRQQRTASSAPTAGKFDYSLPPDKEPPLGYICYRCGKKGHWIQNCPENENPEAQDRKRFNRVTGIPRSFLKTVETPTLGEGSSGGAMLTADGGFVRAVPDKRIFDKQVAAKPRALTNQDVRDQQPLDTSLTCPICKKLVWEAVRTPCCSTAFCEECITTHLVDHSFECPVCESKVPSLDKLQPDQELRDRVRGYVDGEIERSKEQEAEAGEAEKEGDEVKAEGSSTPQPVAAAVNRTNGPNKEDDEENASKVPGMTFDPARMQEMLNPAIMQQYTGHIFKMLQNPLISEDNKAILQAQMNAVTATVMQMENMGMTAAWNANVGRNGMNGMNGSGNANGMMNGMNGNVNGMNMNGMNGMDQMGMAMGGMGNMGNMMPMGNGMGMNMNEGMNMGGGGGGYRGGRGYSRGFRGGRGGGFRGGRGGGGDMGGRQMKRPAEEMGAEVMAGGMEKHPRMG